MHLGISQYGLGSRVKGHKTDHDVANVSPFLFFSFFSLIYSSLGWHRGLDSACCQTKALQYYPDPISALTPMRSPQCYVSLTEKYSHTEKDAILQVEALCCFTDVAQTRVIYTEHTCTACKHALTHSNTSTKGKRGRFVSIWEFFLC